MANNEEFEGLDGFLQDGDPATHLAESRGQYLDIYHIPSGQKIRFKAYVTDYQDKYDASWEPKSVYGRMDPIYQYSGTTRGITIEWAVPS